MEIHGELKGALLERVENDSELVKTGSVAYSKTGDVIKYKDNNLDTKVVASEGYVDNKIGSVPIVPVWLNSYGAFASLKNLAGVGVGDEIPVGTYSYTITQSDIDLINSYSSDGKLYISSYTKAGVSPLTWIDTSNTSRRTLYNSSGGGGQAGILFAIDVSKLAVGEVISFVVSALSIDILYRGFTLATGLHAQDGRQPVQIPTQTFLDAGDRTSKGGAGGRWVPTQSPVSPVANISGGDGGDGLLCETFVSDSNSYRLIANGNNSGKFGQAQTVRITTDGPTRVDGLNGGDTYPVAIGAGGLTNTFGDSDGLVNYAYPCMGIIYILTGEL